jgi:hypothetical protein
MVLVEETLSLILIAFNVFLFADFLVIELVLRLNIFAYGRAWLRVMLISTLLIDGIAVFLLFSETNPKQQQILGILAGLCYLFWDPLYFHMLIEQSEYWMPSLMKKAFYIILLFYTIFDAIIIILFIILNLNLIPLVFYEYIYYMDLVHLIVLSFSEFFILFNIFKESKVKVKSASIKLWRKVQFCLLICTLCIFLDLLMVTIENLGYGLLASQIKACTFSFKVVFECLCFQFIKGIILSIEQ